ncbi:MAG: hypothetical protein ACFB9N_18470 [Geitlerinemataceae cyanobacterium]
MTTPFDSETIAALAGQIDTELAGLQQSKSLSVQKSLEEPDAPLAKQVSEIEKIAKEPAPSFLRKFRKAAKADLCEKGGILNAQWEQWKDLASGDVVKSFGPILVGLGFTGALLEVMVVALGTIVIHIGLKAFCEEFGE